MFPHQESGKDVGSLTEPLYCTGDWLAGGEDVGEKPDRASLLHGRLARRRRRRRGKPDRASLLHGRLARREF